MPQEALEHAAERAETAAIGGRADPTMNVAATDNRNYLVEVTNRKATLRRKLSKKKLYKQRRRRLLFAFLFMVIIGLTVALTVVCSLSEEKQQINPTSIEYCNTKECIASGYRILKAMDNNTDPCEDFYQYACGNWIHEHPMEGEKLETSRFVESRRSLSLEIRDILQDKNSPNDPLPVQQARALYSSCMNTDRLEALGLKPAIDVLKDLELPATLPHVNETEFFNFTKTLANIHCNFTIGDLIFNVMVHSDPHNSSSVQMLIITPPIFYVDIRKSEYNTIVGPDPEYYAEKEKLPLSEFVENEIKYRTSVMAIFEKEHNSTCRLTEKQLEVEALKILILEAQIFKAKSKVGAFTSMKISVLQRKIDNSLKHAKLSDSSTKIDMKLFMKILFLRIPQSHPKNKIVIFDVDYFHNVAVILAQSKPETIEKLMWWKVADYLASLTTREMRELKYSITNPKSSYERVSSCSRHFLEILIIDETLSDLIPRPRPIHPEENDLEYNDTGHQSLHDLIKLLFIWSFIKSMRELKYSITNPKSSYERVSRSKECLLQIHNLMPAAVGYKIATSSQFKTTRKRMEDMLSDIKTAFITMVNETKWMDNHTREYALNKVNAMGHMIGYPEDLVKPGYIENIYNEVMVEEERFLKSVINIHAANAKRTLSKVNSPTEDRKIKKELPDPFIVNAYNSITANFIVIPSGILRVPFYGLGMEALNYGAIGFVLAHELTHSFDNLGRNYDMNGKLNDWWSYNTSKKFEHHAECFRNQYGNYTVGGNKVDGEKTLGENIADNGGLREAVRAYHNYVKHKSPEKKLPGLESFTHDQLLYLAFANVWCSSVTKEGATLQLNDVHSPPHFRVIGTLSNMQEFADTWDCSSKSAMNPPNKCILW